MSAKTVPISRTVLRPIAFRWWQPGKVAPVDCSGFSCVVASTTLPWTPAIAPVDLAQGKFQLLAPTAPQAAQLKAGRHYQVHVVLKDGSGVPIDEFTCPMVTV